MNSELHLDVLKFSTLAAGCTSHPTAGPGRDSEGPARRPARLRLPFHRSKLRLTVAVNSETHRCGQCASRSPQHRPARPSEKRGPDLQGRGGCSLRRGQAGVGRATQQGRPPRGARRGRCPAAGRAAGRRGSGSARSVSLRDSSSFSFKNYDTVLVFGFFLICFLAFCF